jgi:hypothetical protein
VRGISLHSSAASGLAATDLFPSQPTSHLLYVDDAQAWSSIAIVNETNASNVIRMWKTSKGSPDKCRFSAALTIAHDLWFAISDSSTG